MCGEDKSFLIYGWLSTWGDTLVDCCLGSVFSKFYGVLFRRGESGFGTGGVDDFLGAFIDCLNDS